MKTIRQNLSVFQKSKAALIKLMQTKPFDSVFVKDICETCDFSRQYFYRFYPDKLELVRDIFIDDVSTSIGDVFSLKAQMREILHELQRKASFYKALFHSTHEKFFYKMFFQAEEVAIRTLAKNYLYKNFTDEQERSLYFYLHGVTATIDELLSDNLAFDPNALSSLFLQNLPHCLSYLLAEEVTGEQIVYQLRKRVSEL